MDISITIATYVTNQNTITISMPAPKVVTITITKAITRKPEY